MAAWEATSSFVVAVLYERARRTNSDSCSRNQDKNRFVKRGGEIGGGDKRLSISRQESEFVVPNVGLSLRTGHRRPVGDQRSDAKEKSQMSKEDYNKAVVGRWFTDFWGKSCNLGIVDEIAAPDMLLQYSLHEPRRGRQDIKAFMTDFRSAFPDLNFCGTADLIAEGEYVVGRWEGGGTHSGPAFSDFLVGSLPAATGPKMHFTGTTVLRVRDGKILEEIGLDDGVTALTQLGLIKLAA
jgi:predicted ester cyclase